MWDKHEAFGFHYQVGYGSVHDGEQIELDLCCDCFDKIMDMLIPRCKISPIKDTGRKLEVI